MDERLGSAAWRAALVAEYPALSRYAKRLTGNEPDAADLVHDAMMRALSTEGRGAPSGRLGAWLRTVVFRLFVDARRRASREEPVESDVLEQSESQPEPAPRWSHVTVDDVRRTITQLPPHFREPYELFTFRHLSYGKIAVLSSLPPRTVGTRINRARQRLRVLLLAEPPNDNSGAHSQSA